MGRPPVTVAIFVLVAISLLFEVVRFVRSTSATPLAAVLSRLEVLAAQLNTLTATTERIATMTTATGTEIASIKTSLDAIKAGVSSLNDKISALTAQIAASSSTLTPEDQASLDALHAEAQQLAASFAPPPPAGG